MGKEGDVRVGLVDFVHHDDAREAKNAKGHLVMNDKRLKIDIWYGNNQGGKQQRDRSRSPVRGRRRNLDVDFRNLKEKIKRSYKANFLQQNETIP